MKYATPELVVVGSASALVQGGTKGVLDNINPQVEQPPDDVALGLDE